MEKMFEIVSKRVRMCFFLLIKALQKMDRTDVLSDIALVLVRLVE